MGFLHLALLALLVCSGPRASGAQPQPATPAAGTPAAPVEALPTPAMCRVGLTVTALYNLNVVANTFDAEFWVWSVCPDNRFAPIRTMEFFNASAARLSMESTAIVDGLHWTQAHVTGTFRHTWDLTSFPFDRQVLTIEIEDAVSVAADFAYEPDATNPVHESDVEIDAWDIVDSSIDEVTHTYDTDFGNPNPRAGSNDFSRLVVTIAMERNDLTSFIKLTLLAYIAFIISLASFLIPPTDPSLLGRRLAITTATLFTVGLSLRTATTDLGSEEGLTMVDGIHIAALAAILVDAFAALAIWLLVKRGRHHVDLERANFVTMGVVLVGFIVANVWLIASAVIG